MTDSEGDVLGLRRGEVRLVESTARWAALYTEEEQRLRVALSRFAPSIAHCGSTSVPGMPAKPILDILVGIAEPLDLPGLREALAPLGYVHVPHAGVPGHEVFGRGARRTHLLHVVPLEGPAWQRMLRFRDALREAQGFADAYAALKRSLARQHATDRAAYTDAKAGFIEAVLDGRSRMQSLGGPRDPVAASNFPPTEKRVMARSSADITTEWLQAFTDAFNRHDADGIMSFMTDDCVFEASAGPDVCGARFEGRDAVRAAFVDVWATFPDAHWGHGRHFVCDDRGVSEWVFTGTRGDGTRVEVHGCDLFRFRDGRIAVKDSYRKNRPPLPNPNA